MLVMRCLFAHTALSGGYTRLNQLLHEDHFRFMETASSIMKYGYAVAFISWVLGLPLLSYICIYVYI
jgi:hypothetical protein